MQVIWVIVVLLVIFLVGYGLFVYHHYRRETWIFGKYNYVPPEHTIRPGGQVTNLTLQEMAWRQQWK